MTILLAGVDEAGRGPLADTGVRGRAVILDPARPIDGFDDSRSSSANASARRCIR